jgi:SpoVK/Ycf46/Vps4 family AAA+-type ATPase
VEKNVMFKDCQKLPQLYPLLRQLHDMIGLQHIKDGICKMILFELQNLPTHWRNIVLTGNPGVGKTNIAQLIAQIFSCIQNKTSSNEITVGSPLNMISGWEGQTKDKVYELVTEALSKSGVLLIDEAHTLNDNRPERTDAYGKQCIDTLMQCMDKYRDSLLVIFSGYKNEMEKNIIQANPGLRRRIQWFFHVHDYTADELYQIFLQQLQLAHLHLATPNQFDVEWMEQNLKYFPNMGGSIENFIVKIKHVQTCKTFGQTEKQILSDETLREGFQLYKTFVIDSQKPISITQKMGGSSYGHSFPPNNYRF